MTKENGRIFTKNTKQDVRLIPHSFHVTAPDERRFIQSLEVLPSSKVQIHVPSTDSIDSRHDGTVFGSCTHRYQ